MRRLTIKIGNEVAQDLIRNTPVAVIKGRLAGYRFEKFLDRERPILYVCQTKSYDYYLWYNSRVGGYLLKGRFPRNLTDFAYSVEDVPVDVIAACVGAL